MSDENGNKQLTVPKILIGIPILAWTHEFAESFLRFWTDLMTYSHKGKAFHISYCFKYRRPVHMAEEELADLAIRAGCSHLLLMDDDILDVTVEDMLKLLEADKDVIGGIMHTSKFPHAICAFRRYDPDTKVADQPILTSPARLYEVPVDQRQGVVPVDLIPFGFTLIKTKVFDKLEKPWFTCNTQAPTDSWFMDSVMDKGIKPYAHFDVWLNHGGVDRITQPFYVQMGMEKSRRDPSKIIEISREDMQRHMAAMEIKLKDAEVERKQREVSGLRFHEKAEGKEIATPVK